MKILNTLGTFFNASIRRHSYGYIFRRANKNIFEILIFELMKNQSDRFLHSNNILIPVLY